LRLIIDNGTLQTSCQVCYNRIMVIKLNPKKLFKILGIIILILIAITPSYYFYHQYKKTQELLKNPQEAAKQENKKLLEAIARLIDLPSDEEPTVATVFDPEKLKSQSFFVRSKAGDKVLIYSNARKAILYDPIANKIIDVAPINIGTPSATATVSALITSPTPQTQTYSFILLNGTTKVGLTKTYEETLKKVLPNAQIVRRDNAKKNDYTKTFLVDLSGKKSQEADQIAKLLNIQLERLPEDEEKLTVADFLIIIGIDKNQ